MDSLRRRASVMVSSLRLGSFGGSPTLARRQNWMPDAVSLSCYECGAKFTAFRRRHHCRVCGQIFCYKCCAIYISGAEIGCGDDAQVRVCAFCFDFVQKHLRKTDSGSEPPQPPPMPQARPAAQPSVLFSSEQAVLRREEEEEVASSLQRRRSSALPLGTAASSPSVFDTVATLSVNVSELVGSNNNAGNNPGEKGVNKDEVDKMEVEPEELVFLLAELLLVNPYIVIRGNRQNCFSGKDLLEWIDDHGRRLTKANFDPHVTCQRLLEHCVIEAVLGLSDSFHADEASLYRLARHNQRAFRRSRSNSSIRSVHLSALTVVDEEGNVPDWMRRLEVFHGDGETLQKYDSTTELAEEAILATSPLSRAVFELPTKSAKVVSLAEEKRRSLTSAYMNHLEKVLSVLCHKMRLDESLWHPLIMKLTGMVVAKLATDYRTAGDELDARAYVKVKLIPGGTLEESCFVAGEAFSSFVIRKGMAVRLERPRVMLISGSISFHRSEDKYVSLVNLHLQEEEYVRNVCDSILSAKPNLILVEQSVCRPAQDRLFAAGISLVLNVKPHVLERLSRIFSIPIMSSLGSMIRGPQFGFCGLFHAQTFKDSSKQIVRLERSSSSESCSGCALLLRGASISLLKRVKRVIFDFLLVRFHSKYEQAFLEAEFASIKGDSPQSTFGSILCEASQSLSPFLNIAGDTTKRGSRDLLYFNGDIEIDNEGNGYEVQTLVDEVGTEALHSLVSTVLTSGSESESVRDMHVSYRSHITRSRAKKCKKELKIKIGSYHERTNDKRRASVFDQESVLGLGRSLPVLFSSFSPTSKAGPGYCIQPWIVQMRCYGLNDLPLGAFLETFCFSDTYACPNKLCDTPMKEHVRRFCHDRTIVTMIVRTLTEADQERSGLDLFPGVMGANEDSSSASYLLTWKYCSECQVATPIAALGPEAWTLSFASFLLLLFYERQLCHTSQACPHSLHGHHVTYFAKGNAVTTFIVDKLKFFALEPPPSKAAFTHAVLPTDEQRLSLEADVKMINIHGPKLFSLIQEALMITCRERGLSGVSSKALTVATSEENQSLIVEEGESGLMTEFQNDLDNFKTVLKRLNVTIFDSTLDNGQEEVRNAGTDWTFSQYDQSLFDAKRLLNEALDKWKEKLAALNSNHSSSKNKSNKTIEGTKKKSEITRTQSVSDAIVHSDLSSKKRNEGAHFESLLASPFGKHSHLNLGLKQRVLVDEGQPSSIIAHSLLSDEHAEFIRPVETLSSDGTQSSEGSSSALHFDYQFQDDTCKFYCRALFARDFHDLRQRVFGSETTTSFALSLSKCFAWQATGGKSGLLFFKTLDQRFILKQMSKFETASFQNFAPHYFQFVNKTLSEEPTDHSPESLTRTSLLAKILGVYWIGFKNTLTGASLKLNLFVMENLHYGRNIVQSYDLKGSMRNRHVSQQSNESNVVLQDENLLREACERPWYVQLASKQLLLDAIHRDTSFLAENDMMDYSLLVGITEKRDELVIGIIDYLRTFTWDKKLETLVKSMGSKTPTVIEPQLYKRRFTEAMYRNFALVPDTHFKEGLHQPL